MANYGQPSAFVDLRDSESVLNLMKSAFVILIEVQSKMGLLEELCFRKLTKNGQFAFRFMEAAVGCVAPFGGVRAIDVA